MPAALGLSNSGRWFEKQAIAPAAMLSLHATTRITSWYSWS